mgnify:CR=1 FL=1
MEGGDTSFDEMIKSTKRGILVTRFWYIRSVDPQTLLFTGLTRDGTFYIENGQIKYPVKNFRFNESPIIMLNNLEALGKQIGIPGEMLAATVADYNKALDDGTLDSLDPIRTADAVPARPIKTAPFHAIEICAGITYTMGGLAIDDRCRVLDAKGLPIPGLHAAGSATGGIEGGPNVAYLGGLSKAVITGLRAAEHIAKYQP